MKKQNEDDRLKLALSQAGDTSPLEYLTVVAVEQALRKVRAFTCLVIGNRVEADEIVEDALILYLSTDPDPENVEEACAYMIGAVRRLLRTTGARARRGADLEQALAPLLDLRLDTREVAALHLGAGLSVADVAQLLGMDISEALSALDLVREAIGDETFERASPAG